VALADAPGADRPPPFPADAIGLVVLPVPVHAFPRGLFLARRAGRSEAVQVHSLGIDVVGVGMTLHDKPE
jgi:hypothetical protein